MSATRTCPLCGRDNRCGIADAPSCWCTTVTLAPGVADAAAAADAGACVCAECARGEVPSPCTGVCTLDPSRQICLGCGRTTSEIASWPSSSMAQKRAVLQRLVHWRAIDRDRC